MFAGPSEPQERPFPRFTTVISQCSYHRQQICELLNAYHVEDWYLLFEPYYPFTLRHLLDNPSFGPENDATAYHTMSRGIIYQMCLAMAHLEEVQIAHRDICPSNWMLSKDGAIKLIDFSVAISFEPQQMGEEAVRLEFQLGTG